MCTSWKNRPDFPASHWNNNSKNFKKVCSSCRETLDAAAGAQPAVPTLGQSTPSGGQLPLDVNAMNLNAEDWALLDALADEAEFDLSQIPTSQSTQVDLHRHTFAELEADRSELGLNQIPTSQPTQVDLNMYTLAELAAESPTAAPVPTATTPAQTPLPDSPPRTVPNFNQPTAVCHDCGETRLRCQFPRDMWHRNRRLVCHTCRPEAHRTHPLQHRTRQATPNGFGAHPPPSGTPPSRPPQGNTASRSPQT